MERSTMCNGKTHYSDGHSKKLGEVTGGYPILAQTKKSLDSQSSGLNIHWFKLFMSMSNVKSPEGILPDINPRFALVIKHGDRQFNIARCCYSNSSIYQVMSNCHVW